MYDYINIDTKSVENIYLKIFQNLTKVNLDIFLCGRVSKRGNKSVRDTIRSELKYADYITVLYPEDLFTERLNNKMINLLDLEKFLADNCDAILVVCESAGALVELGAFVNNDNTFSKVVALIGSEYKHDKSFIMMGPVRYIETNHKNNVIYYNSNPRTYMNILKRRISMIKRPSHKGLNFISGQFNFIILLLYFYEYIEVSNLANEMEKLYISNFSNRDFEIIYFSALRRLYKEGFIEKVNLHIKKINQEIAIYKLTDRGYDVAKTYIRNIKIGQKGYVLNSLRLNIIKNQYY